VDIHSFGLTSNDVEFFLDVEKANPSLLGLYLIHMAWHVWPGSNGDGDDLDMFARGKAGPSQLSPAMLMADLLVGGHSEYI
jgi:hypothetical protein